MNKRICLWSCPRNVSTALMYSFAQRRDTKVFDEPLYAHYLLQSNANHPARNEILQSQENDGNTAVNNIILKDHALVSFHKLMTHFLININTDFLERVSNIIFIRNPKEIIASYLKVIPNPKMIDIGVKKQFELYHQLSNRGCCPIVLDSQYLLKDPKRILEKLCFFLRIPFEEKMLEWEKGGRREDGVWARYWYKSVHNSTGFLPYIKKETNLEDSNLRLSEKCQPYYEFLTNKSIKV